MERIFTKRFSYAEPLDRYRKKFFTLDYNILEDSFDIYTSDDGMKSWKLVDSYHCHYSTVQARQEESPEFIHFSIIKAIHKLIRGGYEYVLKGV